MVERIEPRSPLPLHVRELNAAVEAAMATLKAWRWNTGFTKADLRLSALEANQEHPTK